MQRLIQKLNIYEFIELIIEKLLILVMGSEKNTFFFFSILYCKSILSVLLSCQNSPVTINMLKYFSVWKWNVLGS